MAIEAELPVVITETGWNTDFGSYDQLAPHARHRRALLSARTGLFHSE